MENNNQQRETTPQYLQKSNVSLKPSIQIENAYKIYKKGKIDVVALRGLTCEFYQGEIAVIMGPSGCGKTTMLNMIGGLDRLSSGKIFVYGNEISQLPDSDIEKFRRDKIGFVFQFSSLIPELNAWENMVLPIKLTGGLAEEKKKWAANLVELVGLRERMHHKPDEMSGGERQRVGVAAALANDPEIVLCDEPTGELDSITKERIMELLQRVIRQYPNKTMIVVTHDPDFKKIADRVYYLRDGKISHVLNKEQLKKLQSQGEVPTSIQEPASATKAKENVLLELREIEHYVKKRIEDLENPQS